MTIDDANYLRMGKKGNIENSQLFFFKFIQQHDLSSQSMFVWNVNKYDFY